MTADGSDAADRTLAPEEAFGALGNGTRMTILRVLADADGPLPFSELRDRVGMEDSGQFNYHLDKLVGHFLARTDAGYELRKPGDRVVEAVLSGAVTEAPTLELTEVDEQCFRCGGGVKVGFREERVEAYCTQCDGMYGEGFAETASMRAADDDEEYGYLGGFDLPSAGLRDRTPMEALETAYVWARMESFVAACGSCPRCAAPVEESTIVCEDHDAADGLCEACHSRYAVLREWRCTNCTRWAGHPLYFKCLTDTAVAAFMLTRGVNPFTDLSTPAHVDYEETLESTDPLAVTYSVSIGDDSVAVSFDETLAVTSVTGRGAADPS